MYIIKFTDAGLADVKALPKDTKNSLKQTLLAKVAIDPISCAEPLRDVLEGWHSFHFLNYRVVYKVFEDIRAIGIVGIGKHDPDIAVDIYRRLEISAKAGRLAESVLVALRGFSGQQ